MSQQAPKANTTKTRAKVQDAIALEREFASVPGRKPKNTTSTIAISSASHLTATGSTASATMTTTANDDYEASKVSKRSNRIEKEEECNMVADLDKWAGDGGVFQFSEASLDDSF